MSRQQHDTDDLRIDELGTETQFVICDNLVSAEALAMFQMKLYRMALGFTVIDGQGGWKGTIEPISIYRIASLTSENRLELVRFLLRNTGMKDLYVVINGQSVGYCLRQPEPPRIAIPGTDLQPNGYGGVERRKIALHGTRDTGWPHK